jgi:hypothetical protein
MVTTDDNGKSARDDAKQLPTEGIPAYLARLAQRAALTTETRNFLACVARPMKQVETKGFAQTTALDPATVRMLWEHQLYWQVRQAAHAALAFMERVAFLDKFDHMV